MTAVVGLKKLALISNGRVSEEHFRNLYGQAFNGKTMNMSLAYFSQTGMKFRAW